MRPISIALTRILHAPIPRKAKVGVNSVTVFQGRVIGEAKILNVVFKTPGDRPSMLSGPAQNID